MQQNRNVSYFNITVKLIEYSMTTLLEFIVCDIIYKLKSKSTYHLSTCKHFYELLLLELWKYFIYRVLRQVFQVLSSVSNITLFLSTFNVLLTISEILLIPSPSLPNGRCKLPSPLILNLCSRFIKDCLWLGVFLIAYYSMHIIWLWL